MGFWSEWSDSNARPREPKSRALPTALHPDIHFSAIIPRQGVKIKIFLSVVIYVVKADFIPLSAIVESPTNAGVARLCGVSPCPVPDTATALPKQARYQLRYTRLLSYSIRLGVFSQSRRATSCATPGYVLFSAAACVCTHFKRKRCFLPRPHSAIPLGGGVRFQTAQAANLNILQFA